MFKSKAFQITQHNIRHRDITKNQYNFLTFCLVQPNTNTYVLVAHPQQPTRQTTLLQVCIHTYTEAYIGCCSRRCSKSVVSRFHKFSLISTIKMLTENVRALLAFPQLSLRYIHVQSDKCPIWHTALKRRCMDVVTMSKP